MKTKTTKVVLCGRKAILDNFNAILLGEALYKLIQLFMEIEL